MLWLFKPSFSSSEAPNITDIDGVIPLLDRRTLKKLRKKYRQYTEQEDKERALRLKIRKTIRGEADEPEAYVEPEALEQLTEQAFEPITIEQLPINWAMFDQLLAELEIRKLNHQKLIYLQRMERQKAIEAYEALVMQAFEKKLHQERRRIRDSRDMELILKILVSL